MKKIVKDLEATGFDRITATLINNIFNISSIRLILLLTRVLDPVYFHIQLKPTRYTCYKIGSKTKQSNFRTTKLFNWEKLNIKKRD